MKLKIITASKVLIPSLLALLALITMVSARGAARGARGGSVEEANDVVMGDYIGAYQATGTSPIEADAKVVPQGMNHYRVILTAHDDKTPHFSVSFNATAESNTMALAGQGDWKGNVEGGKTLVAESPAGKFDLKFTLRHSPTEGQKPPADAIVLLPYTEGKAPSLDEWTGAAWKAMDDGSMVVTSGDTRTKRKLGDFQMHAEFRIPYEPSNRGQDRGNSGFYIHELYELQVLDSYGLPIGKSECGAVYTSVAPKENACFPPKSWQTYEITFHAARFDSDGKKTNDATITVIQNGVKVQDQTAIPGPTGAARGKPEVASATLRLQDHQHPVRYRNIWYTELKDEAAKP
jgi:hypothetical protein